MPKRALFSLMNQKPFANKVNEMQKKKSKSKCGLVEYFQHVRYMLVIVFDAFGLMPEAPGYSEFGRDPCVLSFQLSKTKKCCDNLELNLN